MRVGCAVYLYLLKTYALPIICGKHRIVSEDRERLPEVSCLEKCFSCSVGNHEECKNPKVCECTHLKEEPNDWRQKLRKKHPLRPFLPKKKTS